MSEPDNQSSGDGFILESIRRVLDGDIEAFNGIVRLHQQLIAADLSRRLPAQDVQEVAQDTFLRAFRALPNFRGECPFRFWLLRIARCAALDFWRKKYRRRELMESDLGETGLHQVESVQQEQEAQQAADRDTQSSARAQLAAALAQLSPDDRAVITLVELEENTMEAAAKQLGCGLAAVKVRAFRARHRLKTVLEKLRLKKDT